MRDDELRALREQSDRLRKSIEDAGGLANARELARRWGMSTARVSVLTGAEGFPQPVAEIAGRPVWAFDEVDAWREARLERFGGRRP